MNNTNDSFCEAAMNQPFHVNHTVILHVNDSAKCNRIFRVTSTGQYSVEEVLVKRAHSLAHRAREPINGVTTIEVLTYLKGLHEASEIEVEEITDKYDKYMNAPIDDKERITENEKVYYCSEYLVKSQKVREQEVAAFIMGYISALIYENANWIPADFYEFSYEDAEYWARSFMALEDRYLYWEHLDISKRWNSSKEWEPPHLSIGDRYETSYKTVATWDEAPYGEFKVSALQMFIKEHIIARCYAAYI